MARRHDADQVDHSGGHRGDGRGARAQVLVEQGNGDQHTVHDDGDDKDDDQTHHNDDGSHARQDTGQAQVRVEIQLLVACDWVLLNLRRLGRILGPQMLLQGN